MAFRITNPAQPVEASIRQIAAEQADKALDDLGAQNRPLEERVHEFRKRCKKLRGLIRLVRPAFPDYEEENAAFRDMARKHSGARNTAALAEAYDALMETYDEQVDRTAFASIRRRLTWRRKKLVQHDLEPAIADARARMRAARGRIEDWRLKEAGYDAVADGLAKTYARGRKRMAAARKKDTAEAHHEWRKAAKYHWLHARLLRPIWPEPMAAHAKAAHRLSNLLGDHHDLAVFRETLRAEPDAFGAKKDVSAFLGLIDRRQKALAGEAQALGARLFAEKPKALKRRWAAYWEAGQQADKKAARRAA